MSTLEWYHARVSDYDHKIIKDALLHARVDNLLNIFNPVEGDEADNYIFEANRQWMELHLGSNGIGSSLMIFCYIY